MKCSKNANKSKPKQCFQSLTIKNKNNDFDFLLQSIERQKYGTAINKENYHINNGRFSMKVQPFREDKSKMTCSVTNPLRQVKQLKEKELNMNGENYENMIQKLKNYLSITEPMLEKGMVEEKHRKHGLFIAYELVSMIEMAEQINFCQKPKEQNIFSSLNNTNKIQVKSASTSFNLTNVFSSSFNQGQQSVQFIKKIQNLQEEKLYLESIISHHERANIKMFIKLNEGQSQEIEQYKKLLASLFEKYKQLQKLVKRESDKSQQLQKRLQKSKLVNVCGKKCQNNQQYLTSKIKSLQEIIYEQNESLSLALEQLQKLKKRLEMYQALSFHEQSKRYSYQTKSTSFPLSDLSKSICSDIAFPSMNAESHRNFSNISVISQNEVKNDESLYKMLMIQATAIDQLVGHKK